MPTERIRKPRTEGQKRRRQVRGWFTRAGEFLRTAIHETSPNLDVFDQDRIFEQLTKIIDSFAGSSRKEFRAWASAWVQRMATLAQHVKTMTDVPMDAKCVLNHLPEYDGSIGDLDRLRDWAIQTTINEAARKLRNNELFEEWYRLHQRAVFYGIRRVINRNCADLCYGQPGPYAIDDAVNDLAADFWLWAYNNMDEFQTPGKPIHKQLRDKATCEARRWKKERIGQRKREPEFVGAKDEFHLDLFAQPNNRPTKRKPTADEQANAMTWTLAAA